MKQVSEKFKTALKQYGRQIDVFISYTENGVDKLLDSDTLFSVTPITNGNLLKSVMKQLNFESSAIVPKGTIINLKFGVMVDTRLTVQDVNAMKVDRLNNLQVKELSLLKGFEYIDFGNYVVAEEPEYNADTLSYTHKCFDKLIYSMKDYESLGVPYPINIKNYLSTLANKIGLTLENTTFYNQDKEILNELYLTTDGESLGYTYRDVLDEIAQATGSIICINDNDNIEVKYLTTTNETIDGDLLKDVNVTMKEKYGTVNLIVLSRSGGADKIYYPEALPQNPVPITIEDNQIMNFNNRDEFLEGLYNALNGLNYYINDFTSTGICYLELGDKYNIEIDGTIYNCVLLNDEIDITQGLEEQIHTDMPEQGETDYTKADKTDRKLNQTTLIVDKQNQQIQGIISQIGDRSQKTTTITADIDGLNSKVENVEDLTNTISGTNTITLENCIEGNLLELHIYGNNTVFEQLYPRNDLYPSNDLFPSRASRIIVTNENNNSIVYELGVTEVLRQNGDVKDEYILQNGFAKIIRKINQDGTIKTNEVVEDLGEFYIYLSEGTNTITIQNYTAPIKAKFAIKSEYTEVFATKVEMNSSITQTAEEINLEVRKKVDENEVISKINQSAEAVTIDANKISLNGKNIDLTGDNVIISSNNFNVDRYGNMTCNNATMNHATLKDGQIRIGQESSQSLGQGIIIQSVEGILQIYEDIITIKKNGHGVSIYGDSLGSGYIQITDGTTNITSMDASEVRSPTITQTSLESQKKNFEKYTNALEKLKDIDIYKYNLKSEKDGTKKHIGFVIGDKYNYSEEVTSKDNDGVDVYSFVSLCCQAIKEQQEEIEKLRKEINNGL